MHRRCPSAVAAKLFWVPYRLQRPCGAFFCPCCCVPRDPMVTFKVNINGFLMILYVGRNASPALLGPSGAPPRSPRAFPESPRGLLGERPGPAMGLPVDPQAPSGTLQGFPGRARGAPVASPETLGTLHERLGTSPGLHWRCSKNVGFYRSRLLLHGRSGPGGGLGSPWGSPRVLRGSSGGSG